MIKFLLKRFLYAILIVWGVITVVFFLFNILPGDPAKMMLGQRADLFSVEAIKKDFDFQRRVQDVYLNEAKNDDSLKIIHCADEKGNMPTSEVVFGKIIDLLKTEKIV